MIVKKIELINFRNFKNISLDFNDKLNFIYGDNGVGKTSIVEAIYFLSLTRSFRTNDLFTLVNEDNDYFSIKSEIYEDAIANKIVITLDKDGKHIFVNDKKVNKISDLYYYINCISYVPKDSYLLKSSPKERRNFLNINLSKIDRIYLNKIIEHEKILKSRNELLKQNNVDENLLDVLTNQLIEISYVIDKKRCEYVKKVNDVLSTVFQKLTENNFDIKVVFNPLIDNFNNYKKIAIQKYNESLNKDLKQKTTTIGIHREDFSIYVNNKNIGVYGSQGENKIAILSLKLSQYLLDKNRKPVVILDDILAELDYFHQKRLLNLLNSYSQIFITSSKKEIQNLNNIWYFHIKDKTDIEKEVS